MSSMKIGFHTDAFNSVNWNFEKSLDWAAQHGFDQIECHLIDGIWAPHGLGYSPHLASFEDPVLWRRKMESKGIKFSQIDALFPLSTPEGTTLGVEYVKKVIRWAADAECPMIVTTDSLRKVGGSTDDEIFERMEFNYEEILKTAETFGMKVNMEPHGYYTTQAPFVKRLLEHFNSELLGVNMDTGNTYISGQDPQDYMEPLLPCVRHVHVKDVAKSLSKKMRGKMAAIAISESAIGEGVNAENIKICITRLYGSGFTGTLSLECEGRGGPLLERSRDWVRKQLETITK